MIGRHDRSRPVCSYIYIYINKRNSTIRYLKREWNVTGMHIQTADSPFPTCVSYTSNNFLFCQLARCKTHVRSSKTIVSPSWWISSSVNRGARATARNSCNRTFIGATTTLVTRLRTFSLGKTVNRCDCIGCYSLLSECCLNVGREFRLRSIFLHDFSPRTRVGLVFNN